MPPPNSAMQSNRHQTSTGRALFFWGLLPLFGLCAEQGTGLLSTELPVFPTLGWTAAVVLAVLWARGRRTPSLPAA